MGFDMFISYQLLANLGNNPSLSLAKIVMFFVLRCGGGLRCR